MKRFIFSCFVAMALFMSCQTTNENLAMSSLYSTSSTTMEDIRGTMERTQLLIYKDVGMSGNTVVTLVKLTSGDTTVFYFVVDYLGPEWRFLDTLMLKIDNGSITTLKDDEPDRTTSRRGYNVYVRELVTFGIDSRITEQLKNCNELVIQFDTQPIKIPENGINAIRQFLTN
jgi:hypothetical protein